MKKVLLLISIIFSFSALAQDNILKKNGEEINCKIVEISDSEVKYNQKENEGLNYVTKLSDILVITFANGEKLIPGNTIASKSDASKPDNGTIPAKTVVVLETRKLLTAKKAKQGEVFEVVIQHDVLDANGEMVVFKAGTIALGTVTGVTKNRSLGRPGTLSISVDAVEATDGYDVPVTLNFSEEGENRQAAAVGIGALLFFPALLIKGEAPELPAGTLLRAETRSAYTLKAE